MVRVQVPAIRGRHGGSLVPDHRLVHARSVRVASLHHAAAVVLEDQAVAVVEEPLGAGGVRDLVQTSHRVVGQRGVLRAARADQSVLGVVHVVRRGGLAVRVQVPVQVLAEGAAIGPRNRRILVQTVPRVDLVDDGNLVVVETVRLRARHHLAGGVV